MDTDLVPPSARVAEIQGLYGAFSFSEKLLQKIWLRRDFDFTTAVLTDGRRLRIASPGKWNLLGGPDFRDARLRLGDGPEVVGDVELHLRAADWVAHAHARDPAYRHVILHVVLFEPELGHVTHGAGGAPIPVLVLLPLLNRSLEEYAADEAVENLANRPAARLTNELTVYSPAQLALVLRSYARVRWRQKVRFARLRIERLGWAAACHQSALEVLGFRYNRAPMLRIATRWPLPVWAAGAIMADEAYSAELDAWSVQGVRPANQPRSRLRQYAGWARARPDWPGRLAALGPDLPRLDDEATTRVPRHQAGLPRWRERISDELCADAFGGTRFDNFMCDAVLPLLAARNAADERRGCWFHWFCGDIPPFVAAGLRQLGAINGRDQPACCGLAQGLLGWMIEREVGR